MRWFVETVLLNKIKKKLRTSRDFALRTKDLSYSDKDEIVKIIKDEYLGCKKQYKQLLKMEPSEESAIQIEKDLNRTFPLNDFFKEDRKGFKRLRMVTRAFSCYDNEVNYV